MIVSPENIVLSGKQNCATFLFLHGLGSSEADVYPLACAFHKAGYTCEILRLPIRESALNTANVLNTDEIFTLMDQTIKKYNGSVFLVGFSTGAVLALLYAETRHVEGIFAISAFFASRHKHLVKIASLLAREFPKIPILRRQQTTKRLTRKELMLGRTLPIGAIRFAAEIGQEALTKLPNINCRILFFHSIDDRVARYSSVVAALKQASPASRLITFRGLNHFLQFDIPPTRACLFVLNFFGLIPSDLSTPTSPAQSATDLLRVYRDEQRSWSLILWYVILGTLTALGLLLYNGLGIIIAQPPNPNAPFFLLAYSVKMSLYLILATLYFMFVNRVDVYIKMFVDPLIKGVSWTTFRTNSFVSGRDATYTTRITILPLYVFPFVISTISLVACAYSYRDQIFVVSYGSSVLKISFVITLLLFIYTAFVFTRHSKFARRWLYLVPSAEQTDLQTEALLHNLFRSIAPGCVRQPSSFRRIGRQ